MLRERFGWADGWTEDIVWHHHALHSIMRQKLHTNRITTLMLMTLANWLIILPQIPVLAIQMQCTKRHSERKDSVRLLINSELLQSSLISMIIHHDQVEWNVISGSSIVSSSKLSHTSSCGRNFQTRPSNQTTQFGSCTSVWGSVARFFTSFLNVYHHPYKSKTIIIVTSIALGMHLLTFNSYWRRRVLLISIISNNQFNSFQF